MIYVLYNVYMYIHIANIYIFKAGKLERFIYLI